MADFLPPSIWEDDTMIFQKTEITTAERTARLLTLLFLVGLLMCVMLLSIASSPESQTLPVGLLVKTLPIELLATAFLVLGGLVTVPYAWRGLITTESRLWKALFILALTLIVLMLPLFLLLM